MVGLNNQQVKLNYPSLGRYPTKNEALFALCPVRFRFGALLLKIL